jgi:hypothetical protein
MRPAQRRRDLVVMGYQGVVVVVKIGEERCVVEFKKVR